MKRIYCVNQLIRPEMNVYVEGWGDCTKCFRDKKNSNCKGYYPVVVYIDELFPVKLEENDINFKY